jgi:hypothetical protein
MFIRLLGLDEAVTYALHANSAVAVKSSRLQLPQDRVHL